MIKSISDFVDFISIQNTPDSLSENIYAGKSEMVLMRKKNLLTYLKKMQELSPRIMLIGEAPGYHGCGKTGVPFTDEWAIATEDFFSQRGFKNYALEQERSSAVIWNVLRTKSEIPLMWNIYPFHPFSNTKQSNRQPHAAEIALGRDIMMELLYFFKIEKFFCVGKTSYNALKDVIPDCEYIRHPSHGGLRECTTRLLEILK